MLQGHGKALILGLLLICGAVWFRQSFIAELDRHARGDLDQQWTATRGYLRIEASPSGVKANWYVDLEDPDEASAIRKIQEYCFIADKNGRPLSLSPSYQAIKVDSPANIQSQLKDALSANGARKAIWLTRRSAAGTPFLIRAGVMLGENPPREPYLVAIAAPASRQQRMANAFTWALAGIIFCALLLGWSLRNDFPHIAR